MPLDAVDAAREGHRPAVLVRRVPTWLAATVASCAHFCDHVVALDGAFRYYPDGRASSGAEQQEAIVKTAEAVGLGVTVHVPERMWEGEIEKTNVRFRLGEAIAEPEVDWFFVIDADSVVIEAPPTVREDLEATPLDVGVISLADYIDWHSTPEFEQLAQTTFISGRHFSPLTCFFRAIPGIWCEGTHAHWFAYRDGEKLILRGSDDHDLVPPLNLGQVDRRAPPAPAHPGPALEARRVLPPPRRLRPRARLQGRAARPGARRRCGRERRLGFVAGRS